MADNPRDHAIVVGIDSYGGSIPELRGCVNDAKLFYQWLTTDGLGGLEQANVTLIYDPPGNGARSGPLRPTKDDVEGELGDLVQQFLNTGQPVGSGTPPAASSPSARG